VTSLLLYAVVRDGHPLPDPPPLGLGDPPEAIRLVRGRAVAGFATCPVAVVASPVAEPVNLTDSDAERHLDILLGLLANGPVIPLRLGSVAPDEDAVRDEILGEAAPQLVARLDALDGLVEVHFDADEDETTAIRAVLATDPALSGVRAAAAQTTDVRTRISLGERVADRVITRRAEQAEQLLDELRPFAIADTGRGPMGGPEDPVLRWAFLVHRDPGAPSRRDLRQFDEAVERVRRGHPELVIEYVGPLPAFHFVGPVEPAGEPARSRWGW
jgi:hypothetical protein